MNPLTAIQRWTESKDDYANRCHGALAANPRWRCYRDLGHDGQHMHIDDRFHRIEWS